MESTNSSEPSRRTSSVMPHKKVFKISEEMTNMVLSRPVSARLGTRVPWESRDITPIHMRDVVELNRPASASSAARSDASTASISFTPPDADDFTLNDILVIVEERETNETVSASLVTYRAACLANNTAVLTTVVKTIVSPLMDLSNHSMGPQAALALVKGLSNNSIVETLILDHCDIGDDGVIAIAELLPENSFISFLDLTRNNLSEQGMTKLCSVLVSNRSLKHLNLSHNKLLDIVATHLATVLTVNFTLQSLNLSYNKFTDVGAIRLAVSLDSNTSITNLDLSWNTIGRRGGMALGSSCGRCTSFCSVDLSNNSLSDIGAISFAAALKGGSKMKKLNINKCGFGNAAAIALAEALGNCELEHLSMADNTGVGSDGLQAIFSTAQACTSLKSLDVSGVRMCVATTQRLAELRAAKPDLVVICGTRTTSVSDRETLRERLLELGLKKAKADCGFQNPVVDLKTPGYLSSEDHTVTQDNLQAEESLDSRNARMARRFYDLYPNMGDPMIAVYDFVKKKHMRLTDLFFQMDVNKSGKLSIKELIMGLRKLGCQLEEEQVVELTERLDLDGDGELNYSELHEGQLQYKETKRRIKIEIRDLDENVEDD